MEYPYGYGHREAGGSRDYPPPYPPPPQPNYGGHPPPQPDYGGRYPYPPPPPETYPPAPAPAPVYRSYTRVEVQDYPPVVPPHHHHSFPEAHFHSSQYNNNNNADQRRLTEGDSDDSNFFTSRPSCRVYCKAGGDHYSLAISEGKLVLSHSNLSDPTQHWIKDEKWSTKVKDEDGFPSFALVNKATGQAVKHSYGGGQPVQLIPYNRDGVIDPSILWTESKNLGNGFRAIRMVNNVRLAMDAFHGDDDHGGVHDGTIVVLYDCWEGDNQQWRIVPY